MKSSSKKKKVSLRLYIISIVLSLVLGFILSFQLTHKYLTEFYNWMITTTTISQARLDLEKLTRLHGEEYSKLYDALEIELNAHISTAILYDSTFTDYKHKQEIEEIIFEAKKLYGDSISVPEYDNSEDFQKNKR